MIKPDIKREVPRPPPDKLTVGFILARSFTLSAFALFVDTLRLASDKYDRSGRVLADWHVLASNRHFVTSSCGVQVAPTSAFVDPRRFHYIVVVGGLLGGEMAVDEETIQFLRKADAEQVPLIGLCTGSFILAEAGLMTGHQTCISWLHYRAFRDQFPDLDVRADRLFNLDRRRGSCAGGSSAADIAAQIVRQYLGSDAERNALEVLQIEKARGARDVQVRRPLSLDCNDARIKAVLILMEQTLGDSVTIVALARSVGLSRRQLERLFHQELNLSPAHAYLRIRMEKALALLTQTRASMIEIALEIGLENASHFTQVFRRTFGITPTEYRKQFASGC
uniref:GlxA family transcriptional regulator n=1 Tax=Sinorhizobium sp. KGO-5 TaxID=1470810 RepID=UPI0030C716BE